MKSHTLKINNRHLKDTIEENYFYCLDVFHRCLSVSLVLASQQDEEMMPSIIMENAHYNSLLRDLDKRLKDGHNIIEEIHSKHSLSFFLDMQLYLEEFLRHKHINSVTNIYCLTIDCDYNVIINNKQLGKRYAF